jgi:hypothetical protein
MDTSAITATNGREKTNGQCNQKCLWPERQKVLEAMLNVLRTPSSGSSSERALQSFVDPAIVWKEIENHKALEEFVKNRQRLNLLDLAGKIEFAEGYDYKSLRMGKINDTGRYIRLDRLFKGRKIIRANGVCGIKA